MNDYLKYILVAIALMIVFAFISFFAYVLSRKVKNKRLKKVFKGLASLANEIIKAI